MNKPSVSVPQPLPDHECKYCKTVHVGCCSKACVLKLNPNYPLPSVPAEIESWLIDLRELAATAFRENGHSHAGMGELLGCQDCADVQSAGIKLINTMRDWLPKLLADSTRTQEKP